MGALPDSMMNSLRRFLALVAQHWRIEAAYLYGSQVMGTAGVWSDIDIALVSPDFSTDLFQARLSLMRLAAQVDDRIEPHPFAPQDFNASHPLFTEIQRYGVRIG